MIGRQRLIGWILIVVSALYIVYFLKTRLIALGPAIAGKEWLQFIAMIVILMLGTANVRLAAMREQRSKDTSRRVSE